MTKVRMWWVILALLLVAAVASAGVAGVLVRRSYAHLDYGQPYAAPQVANPFQPVQPGPVDGAAMAARLNQIAKDNPALGTFGAQVIDTATGAVLWQREAARPLVPASATKVLTVAAATLSLPPTAVLSTKIYRGLHAGEVVIKAAGDVWLTPAQLDQAAADIQAAQAGSPVTAVYIDTTVWTGNEQAPGWDPTNVDGGFVAPLQPAMINGGRVGAAVGDVPRSHTPALDVARQLAERLGASTTGFSKTPSGTAELAVMTSPTFAERAEKAVKSSDNVMAEAIGRELALARNKEASFAGADEAVLEVLAAPRAGAPGIDTAGIILHDCSGLSPDNRIPAAALAGVMYHAVQNNAYRPLLGYLPVAGGDGTLYARYAGLSGRGYVRAKTGTLTATSALTGIAQGNSGHIYAFAFLVNAADVPAARAAQDALASVLHDF